MRFSELRRNAHESGSDVDGSRELLIAALEKDSGEDAEEDSQELVGGYTTEPNSSAVVPISLPFLVEHHWMKESTRSS